MRGHAPRDLAKRMNGRARRPHPLFVPDLPRTIYHLITEPPFCCHFVAIFQALFQALSAETTFFVLQSEAPATIETPNQSNICFQTSLLSTNQKPGYLGASQSDRCSPLLGHASGAGWGRWRGNVLTLQSCPYTTYNFNIIFI